jgi:hypothetical protein
VLLGEHIQSTGEPYAYRTPEVFVRDGAELESDPDGREIERIDVAT